eukprot:CAMPEP_0180239514 /NCGR_PEP_ID=MMETSP0987-20121128/31564_1 /TAXON_ID=697907 /ORGANISM="non described non described, Strain CCMP2293" /LENGTH=218 /DNA_ID=CAMNT_0022206233 /DNA_START=111 /DNA_END=763 /DNA_ORIENTATION=+
MANGIRDKVAKMEQEMMDKTATHDPQIKSLEVTIKAVRHLPKMDRFGKCDPYVTFTLGEQGPYQSSIKFKVYDADYDESFTFEAPWAVIRKNLHISVMDWDRIGSDEKVGDIIVIGDTLTKWLHNEVGWKTEEVMAVMSGEEPEKEVKGQDGMAMRAGDTVRGGDIPGRPSRESLRDETPLAERDKGAPARGAGAEAAHEPEQLPEARSEHDPGARHE